MNTRNSFTIYILSVIIASAGGLIESNAGTIDITAFGAKSGDGSDGGRHENRDHRDRASGDRGCEETPRPGLSIRKGKGHRASGKAQADMILVDASAWVFFFKGDKRGVPVRDLVMENWALLHPHVYGELLLGGLSKKAEDLMLSLEIIPEAERDVVLDFIRDRKSVV